MRFATKHGMPHPTLMRFVLKLLANLTDPRGGDAMDRVINAMTQGRPRPERRPAPHRARATAPGVHRIDAAGMPTA